MSANPDITELDELAEINELATDLYLFGGEAKEVPE